jgi:hypothetical protein
VCSWGDQQERDPVPRTVFEQERVIARAKELNPMMDPVDIGGHGKRHGSGIPCSAISSSVAAIL